MFHSYVLGNRVAAPGTAAQSQGGSQFEVIKISDTAVGGRGIYQDTAGLHRRRVLRHLLFFIGIDIQRGGVSVTAVCYKLFRFCKSLVESLRLIHGKYGRKFLMGELFADIHRFHFTDQDLGIFRNFHACHLRDGRCFLSYDLRVQGAVDDNGLSYLIKFVSLQEIASSVLELVFHRLIYALQDSHRLLGSTDHAVVKGLGMDDGINRQTDIRRIVDDNRSISRAYAQGRFTG